MKKLMALIALVAMVAVSSVAYAQSDTALLDASVNSSTTIQACGALDDDITLAAINVDSTTSNSATPCEVIAYSNNIDGITVGLNGSDAGLEETGAGTTEWTKLAATLNAYDVATPNTEAWGFAIGAGTSTEYDLENDADIAGTPDFETGAHSVKYATVAGGADFGSETVVSSTGPVAVDSSFDLVVTVVSSPATAALAYQDTLTLTLVAL